MEEARSVQSPLNQTDLREVLMLTCDHWGVIIDYRPFYETVFPADGLKRLFEMANGETGNIFYPRGGKIQ